MLEIRLTSLDTKRWRRYALLLFVFCLFLWLAVAVRDIWLPLCIAFLIAMTLDPLVDRLERRGWSRLKAAVLIYIAFLGMTGTGLAIVVPTIVNQTATMIKSLQPYLPSESENNTKARLERLLKKVHAPPLVQDAVAQASAQISRSFGHTSEWLGKTAQTLASNLIWLVVIPIVAFYALVDFHLILARLLLLVPRENRNTTQQMVNQVTTIFAAYLRGLVIVCTLNAVVTALVLMGFQVPNPVGLGAISGLLYMVPYLGAALTIALVAGVGLTSIGPQMTLIVTVTLIILHHIIFDQIVTPRIVGKQVGLHPILSLIALLIGGSLLGIIGMILAVPFAATVQMIIQALFPKLGHTIEVPTGEELRAKADEIAEAHIHADETGGAPIVHETILAAVESADETEASPTYSEAAPRTASTGSSFPPGYTQS